MIRSTHDPVLLTGGERVLSRAEVARLQHDAVRLAVNVGIDVVDVATGRVLSQEKGHNLTVTAGMNLVRDFLANESPVGITHFAIGTGSTAPASTDTALVTELLRDLVTQRIKTSLSLTLKYYLPANQGNGSVLREAGLFNAAAGGTMYARYVLSSPITKNSSIAVVWAWELTLAAAA
jgi:hypothetical protein